MRKIKAIFDERFQNWQIDLPLDDLHHLRRGSIQKGGWTIRYRFGEEQGKAYLEYFASHRMTNDSLNRIYEDGTVELVGYCQEFYLAGDEQAERDYLEHNRKFYREVGARGLG